MAKSTGKTLNKKTLVVRLAAAAFVVAGVATIANLARPKSNAADTPIAESNKPPAEAEKRQETKPTVVEPSATDNNEPNAVNPFDTSAVASAFSSKPASFEPPKPFKPADVVKPVKHEEPIDNTPAANELKLEGASPLPNNPFGAGGQGPAIVGAAADTAPPTGAFDKPDATKDAVANKPTPATPPATQFDNKTPLAPIPDSRELPPKDAGLGGANAYQPTSKFGGQRRSNPYVEPRPLRTAPEVEGRGVPGTKKLEGVQSPSLTIEKIVPTEIQVGKPVSFEVVVTNTSQVTAHDVQLIDEVPRGTKLMSTTPRAEQTVDGNVVWALGNLGPDQQASVKMQLMPTAEGEIGSVAIVQYASRASARTIATKPELELTVTAPPKVMKDDKVIMSIRISNPGTGAATGVVLFSPVPPQLLHETGRELEYDIGTLEPGKSRELELVLEAAKAGQVSTLLTATCDGAAKAEALAEFEVIAPELQISVDGPSRRYLERQATYTLSVHNPGTATAKDISLVSYLPDGMKFVEADHLGKYDPEEHAVRWSLEELPPKELGKVKLTAIPVQEGDLKMRIEGTAAQGLKAEQEQMIAVEGIAAIKFHVADVEDPVEVGGETSYEIRVVNQGSKAARNLQVVVVVPPQMKPLGGTGPTRYTVEGGRIIFEPLSRLAPKADTTFTVRVQAIEPGDLRLRVMVRTDGLREPVTKEESTRVYTDE